MWLHVTEAVALLVAGSACGTAVAVACSLEPSTRPPKKASVWLSFNNRCDTLPSRLGLSRDTHFRKSSGNPAQQEEATAAGDVVRVRCRVCAVPVAAQRQLALLCGAGHAARAHPPALTKSGADGHLDGVHLRVRGADAHGTVPRRCVQQRRKENHDNMLRRDGQERGTLSSLRSVMRCSTRRTRVVFMARCGLCILLSRGPAGQNAAT